MASYIDNLDKNFVNATSFKVRTISITEAWENFITVIYFECIFYIIKWIKSIRRVVKFIHEEFGENMLYGYYAFLRCFNGLRKSLKITYYGIKRKSGRIKY